MHYDIIADSFLRTLVLKAETPCECTAENTQVCPSCWARYRIAHLSELMQAGWVA